jgi:hypothetical protein
MNKNRTKILFALSIVTMMLACTTLVFFLRVIKNKNEHTSALTLTLADKMAEKQSTEDTKKKTGEVETTRALVESYFVNSSESDAFINYLEGLGTTAGSEVTVDSLDIAPASKNILLVQISGSGTFSSLMRTLELLENSPYKIHVMRTYFNQQSIVDTTGDAKAPKKTAGPTWKSEIGFSVLLSS